MTRAEVKALRRLVTAESDLKGYIARLTIAQGDGASIAKFGTLTKLKDTWVTEDWESVVPIGIAIEMAERGLTSVRDQLAAAGVTA